MATKKRGAKQISKTAKAGTKTSVRFHRQQTDDPIIIKPGGSLLIEIDKNFSQAHTPSNPKKKGHKHPAATKITEVAIFKKNGVPLKRYSVTDPEAYVQVCYDTPNGCDCA